MGRGVGDGGQRTSELLGKGLQGEIRKWVQEQEASEKRQQSTESGKLRWVTVEGEDLVPFSGCAIPGSPVL